jgi:hypothetical protein
MKLFCHKDLSVRFVGARFARNSEQARIVAALQIQSSTVVFTSNPSVICTYPSEDIFAFLRAVAMLPARLLGAKP